MINMNRPIWGMKWCFAFIFIHIVRVMLFLFYPQTQTWSIVNCQFVVTPMAHHKNDFKCDFDLISSCWDIPSTKINFESRSDNAII